MSRGKQRRQADNPGSRGTRCHQSGRCTCCAPHEEWLQAEASGQKDYESDDSSSWSSEGQPSVLLESMARDGGETSTSGRGEDSQLPAQDRRALAKADAGTLTPVEKQQLVESAGLQLQLWKPPQMPLMWYVPHSPPASLYQISLLIFEDG